MLTDNTKARHNSVTERKWCVYEDEKKQQTKTAQCW